MPDPELDQSSMVAAFNRAASHYQGAAKLQQEIAQRLLARLAADTTLQPQWILDMGCGTGMLTRGLAELYPKAHIVALDIAPSMLSEARKQSPRWFSRQLFCAADAAELPFKADNFDLVVSNLMLQWCPDFLQVFNEVARILSPQGHFLFSSFGPDTLTELRASWASVDDKPHVNQFIDLHALGDALQQAGLQQPVMDVDRITMTFDDALALMRNLKTIGAHNVAHERRRGLLGKAKLQRVIQAYESYRQSDGRLPASYEVTYGYAKAIAGVSGKLANIGIKVI
ncbi:malonyl-ACP O-methyltransferase BioC [Candidatus Venteria ishoeyi]|uniref:malonyl-ACP O-methyltransferase BioC n=1 Tax=Candidatus Venteria ishoeyi TaxID=1899563 RepID=UPI0025A5B687|nr:malonyl-ACP O-methyltransferase BioC [Candidatus Venteria ishoeyi]MDM8546054.1 malonyl-ACP O-methyltransferase BioC [Candidatus Venteria ishoeyi]